MYKKIIYLLLLWCSWKTLSFVMLIFTNQSFACVGFTAGRVIATMVGKFFIYGSYVVIYVQGAEVFPTTVRNIALGTASACGRIGSFVALYIIWLERIHFLVPYAILGVLCLFSGVTCYVFLPETKEMTTCEVLASNMNTIEMENLRIPEKEIMESDV